MAAYGIALFDTAIGPCGVAWSARGIAAIQLPESTQGATRARLCRRLPGALEEAPPPDVVRAIEGIRGLLRGEAIDLGTIDLDMERVPEFHRQVYAEARRIPPRQTVTYGEIARRLGAPAAARAVGQALGRNPFALVVPCHRVLAANGELGGFSADGGVATKRRLLAIEGAAPSRQVPLFDGDGTFRFDPRAAVRHLRATDPALARLIDATGPFRMELKQTTSLFAALAEAIIHQQLSGRAAATIHARVCALFPGAAQSPAPDHILAASDDALRSAGLSRPKLLALRDLAQRAAAGAIPSLAEAHRMADEALIERLVEVRGIGRWTVEMLLMFRLGRPDVLPADDYGIRKGYAVTFRKRELPAPKDLARRGVRWKPYRTVASWYLWRAAEQATRAPAARA